jgi:hypothetical protein
MQDAWEDVDPDELSYEVNLINIKVCDVFPTLCRFLSHVLKSMLHFFSGTTGIG